MAIAIDATVVQAMMTLLSKWSWWMPSWMDRLLPKISIESGDYLAQLPARGDSQPEPDEAGGEDWPARGGTKVQPVPENDEGEPVPAGAEAR